MTNSYTNKQKCIKQQTIVMYYDLILICYIQIQLCFADLNCNLHYLSNTKTTTNTLTYKYTKTIPI